MVLKKRLGRPPGRKSYIKQCEKCLICFKTHREKQKFCNILCYLLSVKRKPIDCFICQKPFRPTNRGKIKRGRPVYLCCSPECAKIKEGLTKQKYNYKFPPGLTKREKRNFRQNFVRNERLKNDHKYRLGEVVRKGIYFSLISKGGSKNGNHWEDLVGWTLGELKKHLEKQFESDMTWENYGRFGWHIDHIIPISVFNFTKPDHEDFKRCWALKNLQPMWADDNLRKNTKLDKPFQPSLKL